MELNTEELKWLLWVLTSHAARSELVYKQRRLNNAAIDKVAKRLRRVEQATRTSSRSALG